MPVSIEPVATQGGLFGVARLVPPGDESIDWSMGWRLRSSVPKGATWCCRDGDSPPDSGETEFKPTIGAITASTFLPFSVLQVEGCSGGLSRAGDQADASQVAQWRLRTYTEGWVARGLEIGVCGNPALTAATNVSVAAPNDGLSRGVSTLLRAFAASGAFERPIIHAPAYLLPYAQDQVGATDGYADWAFSQGYGTGLSPAPAANEAWLYITGRVEYSVQEFPNLAPDNGDGLKPRRRNQTYELGERMALVRFDPNLASRAKVVF